MFKNNKIKKFKTSNIAIILMIVIFVLGFLAYIYVNYSLKQMGDNPEKIASYETLKDVLILLISITGTNLLLSVIVDVNSKNKVLTEFFCTDIISDPKFYENINESDKKEMCSALETNLYFRNSKIQEIYQDIRNKLSELDTDYYFSSCEYNITCRIFENYIEKSMTKKVTMYSYEDSYVIHEFGIGNIASVQVNGMQSFELESLEINSKKIDLKENIEYIDNEISHLDEQNAYNISKKCVYKKDLKLSKLEPTTVVVKCKTRTSAKDKASTFRVTKPCKNFSLVYSIENHNKYRLAVDAFGFLDDADDSVNNPDFGSNVNIRFNDWIFKYDGVVVTILDK